jgi:hypothetical protein
MKMAKKKEKLRSYKPTINLKYSQIRKTELVPETVFDPWYSYSDGLKDFRDKTKIRSKFAWSLMLEEKEMIKANKKNLKLVMRRERKKNKSKK